MHPPIFIGSGSNNNKTRAVNSFPIISTFNNFETCSIKNIWKMNGGGTFFDKPIELAFQEIQNHIDTKKMVRFNFYTDG